MAKPKPVTDCSLASDEELLAELMLRFGGIDPRMNGGTVKMR